jgi:hypothetical protein
MTVQSPPISSPITDKEGKPPLPWILFFNQMYDGDSGVNWIPSFQNLTVVGTPSFSARYYKLSKYITFFRVLIIPSTSTTAVSGSTYIDNFPLDFSSDGIVLAVSGGAGTTPGHIVASTKRIYTPSWSAITNPLTLIGIVEAS